MYMFQSISVKVIIFNDILVLLIQYWLNETNVKQIT